MHNDSARVATVLVVEDDPATLEIETVVLEDEGFRVVQAKNGDDGWCLAQQQQPEVILLDVALPTMSGFQLLSKLKANSSTAHIPVVLVSAYARLVENCHERGASGCVEKPFTLDDLLAAIGRALGTAESLISCESVGSTTRSHDVRTSAKLIHDARYTAIA